MTNFFNSRFFVPVFMLAIGMAFLSFSALQLYEQYQLSKNGVETQGTVIELAEHTSNDGTTYAPVVQFQTKNNRPVTFVSSTWSIPPEYAVNDRVTVVYLPEHPEQAEIKGAGTVLLIIFAVLGSLLIIAGVIFMVFTLRASLADA